jgi:hypothetical protein
MPYRVVVSHLVAGLTLGPEAARARRGQIGVDPVVEIKGARKRVGALLFATGLDREDIEAISIRNTSPRWQALWAVLTAERALDRALDLLHQKTIETFPRLEGPERCTIKP